VVDLLKQWSREKITKDKFYTEIAKLEREVEVAKQTAAREQKIKNSPDPFESVRDSNFLQNTYSISYH